jgi:hypothetical protein
VGIETERERERAEAQGEIEETGETNNKRTNRRIPEGKKKERQSETEERDCRISFKTPAIGSKLRRTGDED